jgi:hypothetical protein
MTRLRSLPEQANRWGSGGRYRRWLKKYSRRIMRRLAKRYGEQAPKRARYRGYE